MDDLEDFLNGSTPVDAPVADQVETPETETDANGPPRDEHGRFAPKGETDTPEPASQTPAPVETAPPAVEKEQGPPPGLLEERRKRQEAEARIAQYEQHFAQLQQQRQPEPEPFIPSVYEDENGFANGLTQQAVNLARQQLMPELQQALGQQKIEMERALMRRFTPDFEQVETSFWEMARDNPVLVQEANRHPNPVEWAYNYAKKAQEVAKIGSMDIDAIKAAAVQEYLSKAGAQPAAPQTIPQTLADAQSARGSAAAPQGPLTLDQILGRK